MEKIIDGKKIAKKIKDNLVKEIIAINKGDLACPKRPNLAIILIGDQAESKLYVNLKEEEAKKVGIDTHLYKCDSDIPERKIFDLINCLNKDHFVDAILLQLPLPKGFDADGLILAINPDKDVDRFHPRNTKILFKTCGHNHVMPPIFMTVLEMLKNINCDLINKKITIVANSDLFGKSFAQVFKCRGATVKTVKFNDKNLKASCREADILITAVGRPKLIKEDMIKKDAIVIDVGITKKGKKVCGDVDFDNAINKVSFITPVPGGVGPVTIAMLFKNTLEMYKKRHKIMK